jgi:aryl-alcohol dehydrogenase-like predicted oxidoreductase
MVQLGGDCFPNACSARRNRQQPFENRSIVKYKLIVDEFGGWALFQDLLETLDEIAKLHNSDIASVASRAVLERSAVAAVIVGARNRNHLRRNLGIPGLSLSQDDFARINAVLASGPIPSRAMSMRWSVTAPAGTVR